MIPREGLFVGYDMYWRREPAEVAEAYAAVHAAQCYDAAIYERWSEAQERHGSYFRLNIFGMGHYRDRRATGTSGFGSCTARVATEAL